MFIIVEGLDRTGKTTLSRQLADEFDLHYRHFSKPEQHPLREYGKWLEFNVMSTVVDRYHWGERVWPTIFDRTTDYDDEGHRWIELLLESRGAMMIHTWRDINEIVSASAKDNEPVQDVRLIRFAHALFHDVARYSILPVQRWKLGEQLPMEFFTRAEARHCLGLSAYNATPGWIGHLSPDVLLVGDEVGPSYNWILPFVPYRGTSGHFLMSELLTTDIKPAIVNSTRGPGGMPERVKELWETLNEPPVIALGASAAQSLLAQGVEHAYVPHPRWEYRFNHEAGPGSYGRQIGDLI